MSSLEKVNKQEEPLLRDDGDLYQTTLKVEGKSYFCKCGCNVFHHPNKRNLNLYACNACNQRFIAE